jgi:hypothetical protein
MSVLLRTPWSKGGLVTEAARASFQLCRAIASTKDPLATLIPAGQPCYPLVAQKVGQVHFRPIENKIKISKKNIFYGI